MDTVSMFSKGQANTRAQRRGYFSWNLLLGSTIPDFPTNFSDSKQQITQMRPINTTSERAGIVTVSLATTVWEIVFEIEPFRSSFDTGMTEASLSGNAIALFVLNSFIVCVSSSTLVWDKENWECLVCSGFVKLKELVFLWN